MIKKRVSIPVAAVLLGGASILFADELADRVVRLELARTNELAATGKHVFARACAACHGPGGRGDGPAAEDLDPPPRDLTSRRFRFRTTPTGSLPRPEDLKRTIRLGLPGTAMAGYGDLFSEAELDGLVAFVYGLHGNPEPPRELVLTAPSGRDATAEGRAIYLISGCWTCHGLDGDGRGPASATLVDELDRPMKLLDLRYDPLKGGRDLESVVRTLRTGLNGAPMPSYDEAMLFAAEDYPVDSVRPTRDVELRAGSAAHRLATADRELLIAFLDTAPDRQEIAASDETSLAALRDARLEALAAYVLSLDRRRGFAYRLFREQPELEGREP